MVERGRPPSYPAVVTAITPGNGTGNNSAGDEMPPPAVGANTLATSPVLTLEAAVRLYERDGDAAASLDACQHLWNDNGHGLKNSANDKAKVGGATAKNDNGKLETNDVPLSWRHNRVVLEHLSSLRSQRRRVRRRPLSFDEGAAADNNNDKKESEDFVVKLSSMLVERSSRKDEGGAAKNAVPKNIKPHPAANAAKDIAGNHKEKKKKKEFTGMGDLRVGGYNQLVGMYNVCLSYYTAGSYQEALDFILSPFVAAMRSVEIDSRGVKLNGLDSKDEIVPGKSGKSSWMGRLAMTTRIAFLVLDCHFASDSGNGLGLGQISSKGVKEDTPVTITTEHILTWIENYMLCFATKGELSMDNEFSELHEFIKHDELKFRLHLYRSRMLFLGKNNGGSGGSGGSRGSGHHNNDLETRARISRKELKNAMDIYQNKLCVTEEGKGHGKKGKRSKQNGGSNGGNGGLGNDGGSYPLASTKGKSNQDVSESTSVTSMAGGSLVTSVSDALWSEGKAGTGAMRAMFEGMPNKAAVQHQQQQQQQQQHTPRPSSPTNVKLKKKDTPGLQVRHETVLYLKANLENLRMNTSKSLKLCAEARSAGKKSRPGGKNVERERLPREDDTGGPKENGHSYTAADKDTDETGSSGDGEAQMAKDYDEAIYYNNLALVHQSAGKIHLALQYYSYALSFMERVKLLDSDSSATDGPPRPAKNQHFWSDGVTRPDISVEILHNTSICAFQAQEFKKSCECMARCVKMSPSVFGKRARCWLRLGQSCIGISTTRRQKLGSGNELVEERNATSVGSNYFCSEEDFQNISTNPLQRASFCLYRALHLSSGNFELDDNTNYEVIPSLKNGSVDVDVDCFKTALVSMAYIKLQLKDRIGAVEICELALRPRMDNGEKVPDTANSLRLREMAEMYYHEATVHTTAG